MKDNDHGNEKLRDASSGERRVKVFEIKTGVFGWGELSSLRIRDPNGEFVDKD